MRVSTFEHVVLTLAIGLLTGAATSRAGAEQAGKLILADGGQTRYVIVVGETASEAERYAAKELADFLEQATGAAFATVTDDSPPTSHELVVGRTNRGSLDDVPAELKPTVPEGYVIRRLGEKVLIMGNIPRATLYGVYEFLEDEVGCRFLSYDPLQAEHINHVPRRERLAVAAKSRKYDPPLEYRSILFVRSSQQAARLRLNGFNYGAIPLEKMLGGGRVVGHAWHSFNVLVPVKDYFDEHPEYFSMKDGRHISEKTQLCLTNEDVYRICLDKLQAMLRADATRESYNPNTLRWVSLTPNDWRNWCECPPCKAIDEEEGGPSGAYTRFVNRIAEALEAEFPQTAVLMFSYMYTIKLPNKARPRHNVIVQIANSSAGVGLSHPRGGKFLRQLESWSGITDRLYTWDYIGWIGPEPYLDPFPTLWNHDETVRIFLKNGLKGYFAQAAQTAHGELRDLRVYLAARCAWRPETDGRKLIAEFCDAYFGPAGPAVVEYINHTHQPMWEGIGLSLKEGGGHVAVTNLLKDDAFLAQADAILDRAEKLADTPERKLRVANQRLGIWYRIIMAEAARTDAAGPAPDRVRLAGQRFIDVSTELKVTHFNEFYGKLHSQFTDDVYPRIRAVIDRQ